MSSERKHTAAPWKVQICKGSYQRPALVVAGKKLVASCMGDQLDPQGTSIGEAEANARLIAAAPDLLAACESLLADADAPKDDHAACRRLYYAWKDIRDAIAKAKGS